MGLDDSRGLLQYGNQRINSDIEEEQTSVLEEGEKKKPKSKINTDGMLIVLLGRVPTQIKKRFWNKKMKIIP